jgi:hypothetical protein
VPLKIEYGHYIRARYGLILSYNWRSPSVTPLQAMANIEICRIKNIGFSSRSHALEALPLTCCSMICFVFSTGGRHADRTIRWPPSPEVHRRFLTGFTGIANHSLAPFVSDPSQFSSEQKRRRHRKIHLFNMPTHIYR